MQQVAALFVRIADEADCNVELIHHVTKAAGDGKAEVSASSGRGGGAVKDKARHVRVLNTMSKDEAVAAGIDPRDRFDYFRIESGKANLTKRSGHPAWRRIISKSIGNGGRMHEPPDHVGVVTAWEFPTASALVDDVTEAQLAAIKARLRGGDWRESDQANAWAGKAIAEILGLEIEEKGAKDKPVKSKVRRMLKQWILAGHFRIEERRDVGRRETLKFVVPAEAPNPD
jgi:hypothetical protein